MDNPSISISPPPNITIFNILIHLPINTLVFKGSDKLQKKAETSITELPSACLSPKKINSSINHLFPNVVLFTAHATNLYPMFAFFFSPHPLAEKNIIFSHSQGFDRRKKKTNPDLQNGENKALQERHQDVIRRFRTGGHSSKKASGAAVVQTNAFFPRCKTHRIHGMVDVYLYICTIKHQPNDVGR